MQSRWQYITAVRAGKEFIAERLKREVEFDGMVSVRKHRRRYENPNDARSLTFSCFHRRPFLSRDGSRLWLVDAIDVARQKHGFHLWAYVIMPEHVHLLIWPNHVVHSISKVLLTIKQSVAKRALVHVRKNAPA